MGASLRVIHVSSGMPQPLPELVERLGLERAALHGWSIDARVGEPAATIVDAARATGVRLIVMCTHTAAARPTAVLGRTALEVLHAAPCPVLLVPPAQRLASWRPNRILLPHDGSPTVNAAVGPAAELARKAGAELLVVSRDRGDRRPGRARFAHDTALCGPTPARVAQLVRRAARASRVFMPGRSAARPPAAPRRRAGPGDRAGGAGIGRPRRPRLEGRMGRRARQNAEARRSRSTLPDNDPAYLKGIYTGPRRN